MGKLKRCREEQWRCKRGIELLSDEDNDTREFSEKIRAGIGSARREKGIHYNRIGDTDNPR